jgi:hypothetical protein
MRHTWFILVLVAFAGFGTAALLRAQDSKHTSVYTSQVPPSLTADAQAPGTTPTTATIVFSTFPSVTAAVTWGKTLLGIIPHDQYLIVVRPRDSGPLDVVVRARGYLPVQTRAYTFSDQKLVVKLTPLSNKNELLGYRVPLDAGAAPDAAPTGIQNVASPDKGTRLPQAEPSQAGTSAPTPTSPPSQSPAPNTAPKPWYKFW